MTATAPLAAALEPRAEGWMWFLAVVGFIVLVLLVLSLLRRRLVRPMPHTPSDTTDSWAEAGRRFRPPPADGDKPDSRREDIR